MTYKEFTDVIEDLNLSVKHQEGLINVYCDEGLVATMMKLEQGQYGTYYEGKNYLDKLSEPVVQNAIEELSNTPVADRY